MSDESPSSGETSGDSQSSKSEDPETSAEPQAPATEAEPDVTAAGPTASADDAAVSAPVATDASSAPAEPKHRTTADLRKRILLIALPLLAVSILLGLVVGVLGWQSSQEGKATEPLVDIASTFPVPPGSEIAFPRTVDQTPPVVVLGWKNEGASIDQACGQWRDAFRSWVRDADPGSVQGAVIAGQSCSMTAHKDGANVTLIVAVYGSEPPQATLTVAQ